MECESILIPAVLILLVVLLIDFYYRRSFDYWKRNNIPYIEPSRPFGNFSDLFLQRKSFGEVLSNIYFGLKKKDHKFGGYYVLTRPVFCPVDNKLVKCILQNDFQYFTDRGIYHDEDIDPLSANLFALSGTNWFRLRKIFTPTFTSGKMKMMFRSILDSSKELENIIETGSGVINIRDISVRFTIDVIGSCAFGINCHSLKDPQVDFLKYGLKILTFSPIEFIKCLLFIAVPKIMKTFRMTIFNPEASKFFLRIVKNTVEYREKNQVKRNDFMNILLELKKGKISFNQLAAQVFIFYAAGFETSSSTMTFCMYELVKNLEVQEKVRGEIRKVLGDGEMTYEGIMRMNYVEQVILETLRMYPILPMLFRECVKDYQIPGTDTMITKGTKIIIPSLGIQRDEEFYPNPEYFDPERFNDENKNNIPSFAYLPFGAGPRNCIGLRFGMLQTKIGLVTMLRNHKFFIDPSSPISPEMDPRSFTLSLKDKIVLKYTKINK